MAKLMTMNDYGVLIRILLEAALFLQITIEKGKKMHFSKQPSRYIQF